MDLLENVMSYGLLSSSLLEKFYSLKRSETFYKESLKQESKTKTTRQPDNGTVTKTLQHGKS